MRIPIFSQKIYPFLLSAYRWYLLTPERSLDAAYQAALKIKAIEDEHFNGNKIDLNSVIYSNSVMDYFESDLKQQLKIARMRLTEFRASRLFSNESHPRAALKTGIEYPSTALILDKLQFIDQVISKYNNLENEVNSSALVNKPQIVKVDAPTSESSLQKLPSQNQEPNKKQRGKADTMGILPRSILSTIGRLQVELDPNAEQDVVKNFRQTQRRTIISIRFILLLIIVPLLTHQISKVLIVGPLINHFRSPDTTQIFLNLEMEEEALVEMQRFEERIKFENLIHSAPPLSAEEMEIEMEDKAQEIAEQFRRKSANAIKNVFSDIFSVAAFIYLLIISKPSIIVLKDFFDHIVYGLSDSAKAFIIILFTDVFVGFHSPHGWEVILEGVSRHWGLPANRDFIFLFIATFPVILDTIFKYWIFRYLNRISPSAVATYRNMNE
ncbi:MULTISPECIES: proton extrusion protein PcxA [unclassified Nodularia (in: cyanobacteria)]|uniref:proton extrusion protein PcxA n=1 Tax=unclassified Nodularia (in: cyanobacteria) TaxID=2656917 RepID=UPI001882299B|nr:MULTISPECIES: proton extrusion protein PcxA [unclassified Nodularia (in: cyanobacteria)]MBE9200642.1 proton extrusion protein PcxA [Nodularia sp. LEGE 06071]MCC2694715.1 proton extrusion protein PcxA [Nodularia sp. LEGE 04288]